MFTPCPAPLVRAIKANNTIFIMYLVYRWHEKHNVASRQYQTNYEPRGVTFTIHDAIRGTGLQKQTWWRLARYYVRKGILQTEIDKEHHNKKYYRLNMEALQKYLIKSIARVSHEEIARKKGHIPPKEAEGITPKPKKKCTNWRDYFDDNNK